MSWLTIALVVAGTIAVIQLVTGFNFSRILFLPGTISPVAKGEIDAATRKELVKAGQHLIKNGFKPACCVKRTPLIKGQEVGFSGVLMYQPKIKTWALLIREQPGMSMLDWRMYLLAVDSSGGTMVTGNLETTTGYDEIPKFYFHCCETLSPQVQIKEHVEFLSGSKIVECARSVALEQFEMAYFRGLIVANKLVETRTGFHFPLTLAMKEIKEGNRLRQEIAKLEKTETNQFLCAEPESKAGSIQRQLEGYQQYHTLMGAKKLGWLAKTALLLASVALFGLVFGLTLSPTVALMLIAVLFIHEAGHLFAMWVLGYKDLSMLFIPFMGALAKGQKARATPWQEAIVLLMGPVPGYVGGIYLLQNADMFPAWVAQFALLSIILNLINLLPFMPLDGGRIINLALFSRTPSLQFAVHFISILFFVFLWYAWGEIVGLVLAVLLTVALPHLWRERKFLSHLLKSGNPAVLASGNLEALVAQLNADPDWRATSAADRFSLLDSMKLKLQHATVSAGAALGIFSIWVFSIVAPPLSVVELNELRMVAAAFGMSSDVSLVRAEWRDAESRFMNAAEPIAQLQAAIDLSQLQYAAEFDSSLNAAFYWKFAKSNVEELELEAPAQIGYFLDLSPSCDYFGEDCGPAYLERATELANSLPLTDPNVFDIYYRMALEPMLDPNLQLHFAALALVTEPSAGENYRMEVLVNRLATLYEQAGDVGQAQAAHERALEIARALNDDYNVDVKIKDLTLFYRRHYGMKRALDFLEPALPETDKVTQSALLGITPSYIAAWLIADNNPFRALELLQSIDTVSRGAAIELKLAQIHISRAQGMATATLQASLSDAVAQMAADGSWYELPTLLLMDDLVDEDGKPIVDEFEQQWYANLRQTLQLPELEVVSRQIADNNPLRFGF